QCDEPAEHRLRTAERGHEERDRDERSDPDHVRHVERRGVNQAEAADHRWGRRRDRLRHDLSAATWRRMAVATAAGASRCGKGPTAASSTRSYLPAKYLSTPSDKLGASQ